MDYEFKNLKQYLNTLGNQLVDNYRNNLSANGVNATGKLGNTLKFKVTKDSTSYYVDLYLEDYWKYVENGRAAGKFPPITSIRDWIRVKPIIPNVYNGKLPTIDDLTYLIRRKIGTRGIPGKHILRDSLEELNIDRIEEALTKDVSIKADQLILII